MPNHDYSFELFENLKEIESKIESEASDKKGKKRKEWLIESLQPEYSSSNQTEGWYSDFQKLSVHFNMANENTQKDLRDIYVSILHPKPDQYFQVPAKTFELLNQLIDYNIDIAAFPKYSFFLQFVFTLAKPYLSKDDNDFYIIDNPIRKEKVFKVPLVSASSWKGNMRFALRQHFGVRNDDHPSLIPLLGNPRNTENDLRSGRLLFYPTFLRNIGVEVFNPHSRKNRAGTKPILFEAVPKDISGIFRMFYFPFDLTGKTDQTQLIVQDLESISQGLCKMFLTYGFSAKKSLDYGITEKSIKGTINMSGIALSNTVPNIPDEFSSFDELSAIFIHLKKEVEANA